MYQIKSTFLSEKDFHNNNNIDVNYVGLKIKKFKIMKSSA